MRLVSGADSFIKRADEFAEISRSTQRWLRDEAAGLFYPAITFLPCRAFLSEEYSIPRERVWPLHIASTLTGNFNLLHPIHAVYGSLRNVSIARGIARRIGLTRRRNVPRGTGMHILSPISRLIIDCEEVEADTVMSTRVKRTLLHRTLFPIWLSPDVPTIQQWLGDSVGKCIGDSSSVSETENGSSIGASPEIKMRRALFVRAIERAHRPRESRKSEGSVRREYIRSEYSLIEWSW